MNKPVKRKNFRKKTAFKNRVKRTKQKLRQTTLVRLLKGIFGPSRKTLEKIKTGLEKQSGRDFTNLMKKSSSGDKATILLRVLKESQRLEESRAEEKIDEMGAKYALNALGIKDREKRKRIVNLIKECRASYNFMRSQRVVDPESVYDKMALGLLKEFGLARTLAFATVFKAKTGSIEKKFIEIENTGNRHAFKDNQ